MSNTPRTDAATVRMERLDGDIDEVVAAFFARQLERELIAARSATAATQDAQAIVASCCAAFDCRPSELLGMILGLKGTASPVEVAAIPVPTGCGAIFKAPEGWSCDCERAHPAPCKANASPTTKEQS